MADESLQLSEPTDALRDEFLAFRNEFAAAGESQVHGLGPMKGNDFAAELAACADQAAGRNLADGTVPATTRWLVRNGKAIIGTVNIRHRLNAFLEHEGGHIGYSVCPAERNKGYATRLLAMALEMARSLGVRRALLVCDKSNPASAAVIRKNGGVLENEVICTKDGELMQRYWIAL
jgi:predicted acetyltransferase